jgi:predicted phosphodiesterase
MIVAVLSDIHANAFALGAVLQQARKAGAERLVLLGDYVGYYYHPREVVAELMQWPHDAILGNHDRLALAARHHADVRTDYRRRYGSGIDLAVEQLESGHWRWLESLPLQNTIELGRWRIHLAHGAPFDDDAYVYPDASGDRLDLVRTGIDADAIWLGHTHWPFHVLGSPMILNPGSVGQPRDLGGVASWALFNADTGAIALRRTEFPVAALREECAVRDSHLPALREVLRRRRIDAEAA